MMILLNKEGMIKNLQFLSGLGKSGRVVLEFQLACYAEIADPTEPFLNLNKDNYNLWNTHHSSTSWTAAAEMDTEGMYQFKSILTALMSTCSPDQD